MMQGKHIFEHRLDTTRSFRSISSQPTTADVATSSQKNPLSIVQSAKHFLSIKDWRDVDVMEISSTLHKLLAPYNQYAVSNKMRQEALHSLHDEHQLRDLDLAIQLILQWIKQAIQHPQISTHVLPPLFHLVLHGIIQQGSFLTHHSLTIQNTLQYTTTDKKYQQNEGEFNYFTEMALSVLQSMEQLAATTKQQHHETNETIQQSVLLPNENAYCMTIQALLFSLPNRNTLSTTNKNYGLQKRSDDENDHPKNRLKMAALAVQLLRRCIKNNDSAGIFTWNSCLNVLVKCSTTANNEKYENGPVKLAELLLQEMESQRDDTIPRPNVFSYTTVLHGLAVSRQAQRAQDIFDALLDEHTQKQHSTNNDGTQEPLPELSIEMLNCCLDAWSKQGEAERAEALLHRTMEKKHPLLEPDTVSYCSVIRAWAKASAMGDVDAAERAHAWLQVCKANQDAQKRQQPDNESLQSTLWSESQQQQQKRQKSTSLPVAYAVTIHAWSKNSSPLAATRALELLSEMEQGYANGNSALCPTIAVYTSVIHALAKRCSQGNNHDTKTSSHQEEEKDNGIIHVNDAAEMAERLLRQAKSLSTSIPREAPNTITYCAVMDAWCKSSHRIEDAPYRALALLREMQREYFKENNMYVRPDVVAYGSVMDAFARQGKAYEAHNLLKEMLSSSPSERTHDKNRRRYIFVQDDLGSKLKVVAPAPRAWSFVSVLHAYAKYNPNNDEEEEEEEDELIDSSIDIVTTLFEQMQQEGIEPNVIVYNTAIRALGNQEISPPDAPHEAERLFFELYDKYCLRQKEAASEKLETGTSNEDELRPNLDTFAAVLRAWEASRASEAPERVTALMDWAKNSFGKKNRGKPNGRNNYKNNNDDDLQLYPNKLCHDILLRIWSKSSRHDVLARTWRIVEEMKHHDDPDQHPDAISYNAILATIQPKHYPHKGEFIKRRMQVLRMMNDDEKLRPDHVSFNLVLASCASIIFASNQDTSIVAPILQEVGGMLLGKKKRPNGNDRNVKEEEEKDNCHSVWTPTTYKLFFDACRHVAPDPELLKAVLDVCRQTDCYSKQVEESVAFLPALK